MNTHDILFNEELDKNVFACFSRDLHDPVWFMYLITFLAAVCVFLPCLSHNNYFGN